MQSRLEASRTHPSGRTTHQHLLEIARGSRESVERRIHIARLCRNLQPRSKKFRSSEVRAGGNSGLAKSLDVELDTASREHKQPKLFQSYPLRKSYLFGAPFSATALLEIQAVNMQAVK